MFRNHLTLGSFLSLLIWMGAVDAATAQDWRHSGPIASGDMTAYVDYQVSHSVPAGDVWNGGPARGPASYLYEASPLWVNIRRANLVAGDHVFVQIINYGRYCSRHNCNDVQRISERDLEFAEDGRFTGQMDPVTLDFQLNDGYALSSLRPFRQELVVWINGELYQDHEGRNLKFSMNR